MAARTTRKIPLRNRAGEVIAEAEVDEMDFERVNGVGRWSLAKRGYAYRRTGRGPRGAVVQTEIKMHRFVFGLTPEDPMVDHRDRNPLNNTRGNLRMATNAQNGQNRDGKQGSSSRYRGVFWDKGVEKWRAQHMLNGRTIYIGIFPDEDDAAEAARLWRLEHMPFSEEPV